MLGCPYSSGKETKAVWQQFDTGRAPWMRGSLTEELGLFYFLDVALGLTR
jgi:hypothetical protein